MLDQEKCPPPFHNNNRVDLETLAANNILQVFYIHSYNPHHVGGLGETNSFRENMFSPTKYLHRAQSGHTNIINTDRARERESTGIGKCFKQTQLCTIARKFYYHDYGVHLLVAYRQKKKVTSILNMKYCVRYVAQRRIHKQLKFDTVDKCNAALFHLIRRKDDIQTPIHIQTRSSIMDYVQPRCVAMKVRACAAWLSLFCFQFCSITG